MHVGSQLLRDATLRASNAAEIVGAKALFVEPASDSATKFYEHYGFRVVPEFLRTLVFARPRGDDQFADCTFSPSLDMSR